MKLINSDPAFKLGAFFALFSLSACGWVDSTGNQTEAPPAMIDSSLAILGNGDSFSLNENTQRTVAFSSSDSALTNWSWRLLDGQANIQNCQRFDGFDLSHASNLLRQSCSDSGSCEIELEEQTIDNVTRFNVTIPKMRTPAALEFEFTARNRIGEAVERRQLLCAIAINDAPDAVDDLLTVTRGSALSVSGDDDQSLLANDDDDDDIRNLNLTVNTEAVEEPLYAEYFELFSDGGFIYEPKIDAPVSNNGSISDRFIYSVSDGSNSNTATVSIKITAFNSAPALIADLPEINATIAEGVDDITLFNLRYYFSDAELDSLNFNALESSLPESGNVYLTNEGLLKGNPTDIDSGRYFVTLTVSDSIASVDANLYLNIVRGSGDNRPPYADDINNKTVINPFSYDVSGFFNDPDQDHLAFTMTDAPEGVEISPDGLIYGTSTADNRGLYLIRVFANDGNGGTNSDGFKLEIR